MALISEATRALVEGIAAEAQRFETPCGDGTMVWHCWGSGPPLVLLHGGYGSWSHWIRNVLPLSRHFRVIAADLPGLGESATPPEPWTAEGLAQIIVAGLAAIVPRSEELRLAGFSFGGVIGGSVVAQLGDRVRSFTVVGSNGLGVVRSPTPLRRVPPEADEGEEFATHRYNLNQLMIADPAKIDELALYLQQTNHARARMRSRRFSRSDALASALPNITARLDGGGPLCRRARRRALGAIRGGRPVQHAARRVRRMISGRLLHTGRASRGYPARSGRFSNPGATS